MKEKQENQTAAISKDFYSYNWAKRIYINFLERSVAADDYDLEMVKKVKLYRLNLPEGVNKYVTATLNMNTVGDLLKIGASYLTDVKLISKSEVAKTQRLISKLIFHPETAVSHAGAVPGRSNKKTHVI